MSNYRSTASHHRGPARKTDARGLVLGICDGHDSGACLVDGGTGALVAAVSSERFSGVKRQPGFPGEAARWCLTAAGAGASDVGAVAVAERAGRAAMRVLDRWYRRTEPSLPLDRRANLASMAWQNLVSRGAVTRNLESAVSARVLAHRVRGLGLGAPVRLVDHHRAHAVSAAYSSGMDRALVVTMDAYGDACSGSVWRWSRGRLEPLARIPFPHSPALLYGLVTCHLGYREGDEGKVSGLAGTGDPAATAPIISRVFRQTGGGLELRRVPTMGWLKRALEGHSRADVAAGLQRAVEQLVGAHVACWVDRLGERNLCLAGGLFANVRLNQAVVAAAGCEDLHVFPHMGDGGLCAGAAWDVAGVTPGQVCSMFIGPGEGTPRPPVRAGDPDLEVSPLDGEALARVAGLLAGGAAVAVASGPMEFGPRALGNRSLLFAATDPRLAAEVGLALDRPPEMPFAPVVRDRDLARVVSGPRLTAMEFMAVTADARPGLASRLPVAVHQDGSLRLQVATARSTPLLYDILTRYGEHMDPAVLINTSLNAHREPIVRTATRARELFWRTPLIAALVLGDQLLVKRR